MGKPLAVETRRAIVRMAGRAECSQAEIAQSFKIGERSVRRYLMMYRQGGDVDSHARFGGHMRPVLEKHASEVEALIKETPDATLEEIKDVLSSRKIVAGTTTIFRFLKRLGYSNKKNGIWSRAETQGRGGTKGSFQKPAKRA
jgi:putative transposase